MRNHNDKNNSSMMWMMLLCLLILVFVLSFALFTGGAGSASWVLWIAIGAMVGGHLWMMFRGHGSDSSDEEHHDVVNEKQSSQKNAMSADEKKGNSSHSRYH